VLGLFLVFALLLGSVLVALAAVPSHLFGPSAVAWFVSERRGDLGFLGAMSVFCVIIGYVLAGGASIP
jgi:hypothetical protein